MIRADELSGTRYGFLVATVFVAGLLLMLTAKPAHAETTFTVNSTGDGADARILDGVCDVDTAIPGDQCTLRAAITAATHSGTTSTINFAIPGNGPHTIAPTSPLPPILQNTTIDGYSESLDERTPARPNTATDKTTNAVLRIELSGANVGSLASGLELYAFSVVKGLAINNWNKGIVFVPNSAGGARIEGNFIGTNPSSTERRGNFSAGVDIQSSSNTIGGTTPATRNLISSNNGSGVVINDTDSSNATNNKVEGNLIGVPSKGIYAGNYGNGGAGVSIFASGNTVGGTDPGSANTIAYNGGSLSGCCGVQVREGNGNRIISNHFSGNDQLGIELGFDGVTANDRKDPDSGSNNLQNFPVLASATASATGTVTIKGELNSRPRKSYTIQFFSGPGTASANGEAWTFLGQRTVKTSRKGNASFTFSAALLGSEPVVTATATNNATGDTSEFSKALEVQ